MSDLAIRAQHVGKRYRLGQREHYRALRDVITDSVAGVTRLFRRREVGGDAGRAHVWALKDVSFEVRQGDVVGVIGRNGAGKSTLLKILSRITEPTEGFVDVKGRCGALLEVGTGFHPELTGRENIFLNAAILGMKRTEILRKFDEIVAFAEIDQFLDTVVKRYSSGMYMRLAFAVAAHLEPDILVVDEVLAVGDTAFQKKCLGKMGEIAQGGRPVIFVSHNMSAIHRLCNRAILLNQGQILIDGTVDEAVREYLKLGLTELGERSWPDLASAPGNDLVKLLAIRTRDTSGDVATHVDVRDAFAVEIDYAVLRGGAQVSACLEFVDAMGAAIFGTFDSYVNGPWGDQPPHGVGRFRATCEVPGDLLSEGDISLNVRLFSPPAQPNDRPHVRELGVLRISVNDRMDPGGARGLFPYHWGAVAVRPSLAWRTNPLPEQSQA
jgi:lipopolysaccharide transport system ATP-binding protein